MSHAAGGARGAGGVIGSDGVADGVPRRLAIRASIYPSEVLCKGGEAGGAIDDSGIPAGRVGDIGLAGLAGRCGQFKIIRTKITTHKTPAGW